MVIRIGFYLFLTVLGALLGFLDGSRPDHMSLVDNVIAGAISAPVSTAIFLAICRQTDRENHAVMMAGTGGRCFRGDSCTICIED